MKDMPLEALSPYTSGAKRAGSVAWLAFVAVFVAGVVGGGFVLARQNGRGLGLGDGGLVVSCYAAGGPYFREDIPPRLAGLPERCDLWAGQARTERAHGSRRAEGRARLR